MDKILLNLIVALHTIMVLLIIIIPFVGKNYLLFLHALSGIFIMVHWLTNNNICVLTLIEHELRERITGKPVDRNNCFMARLIEPVYDFKKNYQSRRIFIYGFMIFFVSISTYKLVNNYRTGKLRNIFDFYLK